MQEAGICRDCALTVVPGPDEYLFGEEKALLEVIEGKPPLPRLLPPHEHGLFTTTPQAGWESATPSAPFDELGSNPTLVNNVETLSNVPHLMVRGPDWYRAMGTTESPGTLVCTFVGDVARPGVAEVEMGTPLASVLEEVTGTDPSSVKAVFSGVANPVLTADHLDVPISYEGFAAAGSGMGAGGFIVYDHSACMVEVARQFSRFLSVESCGQCPACKRGSAEITTLLGAVEAGSASERDIAEIGSWLAKVTDGNRCYLAVEEQVVVSSVLRAFPEEFTDHLERGVCPRPRALPFPKIAELRDGAVRYDLHQLRKRTDWTYA
jgi:NADH:ubiquinone oxidoreductase subunit F (NADH-binding)